MLEARDLIRIRRTRGLLRCCDGSGVTIHSNRGRDEKTEKTSDEGPRDEEHHLTNLHRVPSFHRTESRKRSAGIVRERESGRESVAEP